MIAWNDGTGNLSDITNKTSSGRVSHSRHGDKYLGNGFIADLNNLAGTIITEVNNLHKEGMA